MARCLLLFAIFGCLIRATVQQAQCSASQLCPIGCCSRSGYCGFGPDYCGDGCQSGCDRKADCNPGWKGGSWSKQEKCPLNVCCSKYGFCGYTKDFCQGNEVKRPSCSSNTKVDRVIGYYEAWAKSQRPCLNMAPEDIPFGYYTHIIFSFATIDPATFKVSAGSAQTEDIMSRIQAIKLVQPDVKIWVAIGGWAFNDPGPTATLFSDMAASQSHTDVFIKSLGRFMNQYGFDGIDIDWEYPGAEDRHGRAGDYKNVVTFMKRLRKGMKQMKKGVSMAIPASYWYLQHFDVKALEPSVDWFNMMTYDVHGAWDIDNKWTGPWANAHTNLTEIQQALDLLWRNDINPGKVTMGMSYYSRSFTLSDPGCADPGCRIVSAGRAGKCSGTAGVLLQPEVQEIIKDKGLKPKLHRDAAVKTVSWDNQWVSFDDAVTWRLKANLLRRQCISGFMVWAMSQDDSSNTNAKALTSVLGRPTMKFPKFDVPIEKLTVEAPVPESCRWTSCFEGCPVGYKEVQRHGHKEIMLDGQICERNGFKSLGFARLCCPADLPLPICQWRGHRNSGKCKPGCEPGEVEVGTLRTGCRKNHQSACCTVNEATAMYRNCFWGPCLPDGQDLCGGKRPHTVVSSSIGSGGMQQCKKGQKRTMCCTDPPPRELSGKCAWRSDWSHLENPAKSFICESSCPPNQLKVALEDGRRSHRCLGDIAFCCARPVEKEVEPRSDIDAFGSAQAHDFRLLLTKYMDNPTCPATILHPTIHDAFSSPMPHRKRSLEMEAAEWRVLSGRAINCSKDNWTRLLLFATMMLQMQHRELEPLARIWDEEFADHYDEVLRFASLRRFLAQNEDRSPRGLLDFVLYNPLNAGAGIRRLQRFNQVFCQFPQNGRTKRDAQSSASVEARHIFSEEGSDPEVPDIETIFDGILAGHLTLHYARWEWQSGQGSRSPPGPILEMAYWIGPEPGRDIWDSVLDRYRDTRPRQADRDRWVVFHLHVNPNTELLRNIDGRTYLGIERFQFFHGQAITHQYRDWRVHNQDYLNSREGLNCQVDQNPLWYVGAPDPNVNSWDRWEQLMHAWGQLVYTQGYVRTPGIALIYEGPQTSQRELDPDNPGTLSWRNRPTAAAGNISPYGLNWLIDSNDFYNFGPPGPGDAPEYS